MDDSNDHVGPQDSALARIANHAHAGVPVNCVANACQSVEKYRFVARLVLYIVRSPDDHDFSVVESGHGWLDPRLQAFDRDLEELPPSRELARVNSLD